MILLLLMLLLDNETDTLFRAVEENDLPAIKALQAQGVDLEMELKGKKRALDMAITHGHQEVVTYLLEQGVRVNRKRGTQPLHLAVGHGTTAIVAQLLARGAAVDRADELKRTALMKAAAKGDKTCFDLLLENGASLKRRDQFRRNLLFYAAEGGNPAIMSYLMERGISHESRDRQGNRPIVAAAKGGPEALALLRDAGEDLSYKNKFGDGLIHFAALDGNVESVDWLIQQGLDVNARGRNGTSPLMAAVLGANVEVVKTLMNQGADPELKDNSGDSPLSYVYYLRNPKLYRVICENGWEGAPLHCAIRAGDPAATKRLLEGGQPVNAQNPMGESALYVAVAEGREDMVRLLLEQKADPEITTAYGWNSLYLAAREGKAPIVNALLAVGTDVNQPVPGGDTPVGAAASADHTEIANALISAGARYLYFFPNTTQARSFDGATQSELKQEHANALETGSFEKAAVPFWLANPDESSIHRLNERGVVPPRFTHKVQPGYPRDAIAEGIQGHVILEAVLGKDGYIRDIQVLRPLGGWRYGFEAQAIHALRQWQYMPGLENGEPADIRMTVKIDFALQR